MLSFDDFKKVELKTAMIIEAEDHPNADKLYVLKIQVGDEQKQIVAGIRAHYAKEDLVGKTIVVVNNLEPVILRGQESQGMLLCASNGESLALLTPEKDMPSGAQIR
ncbi:MAG: methionine--tRNA ligase subunit beta [Candidatus Omnitrophota bacterium]